MSSDSTQNDEDSPNTEIDGGWGVVILSAIAGLYGALIVLDSLLPGVDSRGNATYDIAPLPVIIGAFMIVLAIFIYKGENWARWFICAMPCIGIVSLIFLPFASSGRIPILTSLLISLPLLLTNQSRRFFRYNREKKLNSETTK